MNFGRVASRSGQVSNLPLQDSYIQPATPEIIGLEVLRFCLLSNNFWVNLQHESYSHRHELASLLYRSTAGVAYACGTWLLIVAL